jgi:hypothetical protein
MNTTIKPGMLSFGCIARMQLGLTGMKTIILISAIVIAGCATGLSQYQRSFDVSVQFEKGRLLDDHRYYAGGPPTKPNAIVALQKEYTLESPHWREIPDVTPEALKTLVSRISQVDGAEYKERQRMHNGARLFGPDGRQVGAWYSVYDYSQVKFLEDNRVYLSFPPAQLPPGVRVPRFEQDRPWPN